MIKERVFVCWRTRLTRLLQVSRGDCSIVEPISRLLAFRSAPERQPVKYTSFVVWCWCTALVSAVALFAGCNSVSGPPTDETSSVGADEVLGRMITAYRDATAYSDRAYVKLQIKEEEQWREQEEEARVAWGENRQLAIHTSALQLVCNGEKWYAAISPQWQDLDGQVVVRDAPERVDFDALHQDSMIKSQLMGGLGPLVQLELLLSDQPLAEMLTAANRKQVLPPLPIEGQPCRRIELVTEEGSFVLWIDQDQYLLRRLELPSSQWLTAASERREDSVRWSVEFEGAVFAPDNKGARFTFDMPADARPVEAFVTPPKPVPVDLYGKQVGRFAFQTIEGDEWSAEQIAGKQVVLMWFNIHPASEFNLRQLELLANRYRDNPDWKIYAIFAEPARLSPDQLRQVLMNWDVTVPVLLDTQSVGRDQFYLSVAPAVVVMNRESIVQTIIVEREEALEKRLLEDMKRIDAGELLADVNRAAEKQLRSEYEALVAVNSPEDATLVALPRAGIREAAEPQQLSLVRLWESQDVQLPLDMQVLDPGGSEQRVLVLESAKTVAEFDASGTFLTRHSLQVPESARVDVLRGVTTEDGRRFIAVTGTLGQQVHLLDGEYRHVISYPPAGQRHDGINDVQFADLNQDGAPELYVGFWGPLGVHVVSLDGQRSWSSRVIANVLSLAPRPGAGDYSGVLLVSNDRGGISVFDEKGESKRTIAVPGQNIHHLFNGHRENGVAGYLGIAFAPNEAPSAIGLAANFEEQWSLELSPGPFRGQLVGYGKFLRKTRGDWIVAGSDGTIRIIGQDGEFFDYFSLGQTVTALATGKYQDTPCLFVATDDSLIAFQLVEKTP